MLFIAQGDSRMVALQLTLINSI